MPERINRTLMDMVRSTRSNSSLPHLLWIEALKMVAYILNRFSTKLSKRRHLSYLNVGNPVYDIYAYGDAHLKWGFIVHKKRNWTQGLLVGISIDMPRSPKVINSLVLLTPLELLNQETRSFSRMT